MRAPFPPEVDPPLSNYWCHETNTWKVCEVVWHGAIPTVAGKGMLIVPFYSIWKRSYRPLPVKVELECAA